MVQLKLHKKGTKVIRWQFQFLNGSIKATESYEKTEKLLVSIPQWFN